MWQRQFRFVVDIIIGDHVQIQRARSPVPFIGAVATELLFDLVQREEKRVWIQISSRFRCRH